MFCVLSDGSFIKDFAELPNFSKLSLGFALIGIEYSLSKRGSEAIYNCENYWEKDYVEYGEGVANNTNYLDKFLTFAFKNGDKWFVGLESNYRLYRKGFQQKNKSTKY